MSRIPPAPGSSSRTAGLPSNPDMRQAFPSDAFTSSSGGGGGGPYPPAQAQRASPRRPTRSVRRPNHSATPSTSSIPPPPTHSDDRDFTRSPSPEGITRRPTWEEERTEREHQVASVPSPSGSDVFRKAQVGKAFASSGRDRQNSYETGRSKKGKEVREMDPDLQGDFGGQFKGIDKILQRIRTDYSVVMDPEFNSIPLALALLESDRSTIFDFTNLSDSLLNSLQSTVQTHSASFASSISTHNAFLSSLNQSQQDVRSTKAMLNETKEALRGEKRAEINALSSRGRAVKDMMDLLDTIEHLKVIPDQLDTLVSEKRLLLAALVLVRSIKTINKPSLKEVGALSDLRNYLSTQETTIRDILLEELHNHIYLKSYYCETRWVPYVRGQTKLQDPAVVSAAMSERSASQTNGASTPPSASGSQADTPSPLSDRPALLSQYLNDLAMRPSQDPFLDLPEDLDLSSSAFATPAHSRNGLSLANGGLSAGALSSSAAGSSGKSFNPEADSFVYIEHLLEALAVLGRLGWALDALAQRESSEIFSLVDGTIQEVEERSVDRRRQTMMNLLPSASFLPPPPSAETKDSPTSDDKPTASTSGLAGKLDEDSETLRDLYWTMYSKLDAVLQGFRVTSEVASRIGSRKDFKDNSYSMLRNGAGMDVADVWRPIQAEVKGLLREYLTSNNPAATAGRNPVASVNDILRDGRIYRDRSKNLFRFNDSDPKATKRTLKKHDDELSRALRSSLPGLVGPTTDAAGDRGAVAASLDDKAEGTVGSHRLLVTPDAHLVSIVFAPTLAFLTRASAVLRINLETENLGLETYVKAAYQTPSVNGS